MRTRSKTMVLFALALGLAAAGLTGCSSVQPWAHGGTDHPTQAGGSVRVPFAASPRGDTFDTRSCTEPRWF